MPPRTTFALADRQKDSCLHPSRPKRNIIQKEKAGNAPSLAHEKGHRQTDRQTHRQTTTTLIASGPPLRGDPYFVCISTTLLRKNYLRTLVVMLLRVDMRYGVRAGVQVTDPGDCTPSASRTRGNDMAGNSSGVGSGVRQSILKSEG